MNKNAPVKRNARSCARPVPAGRTMSLLGSAPRSLRVFTELSIVFIMAAHPEGPAVTLITAFRHHVKVVIVDVQHVIAAEVTRVRVKNIAAVVLVEHAVTLTPRSIGIL